MSVNNGNEPVLHKILMPLATISRITPHTLKIRIESIGDTTITPSFLVILLSI